MTRRLRVLQEYVRAEAPALRGAARAAAIADPIVAEAKKIVGFSH